MRTRSSVAIGIFLIFYISFGALLTANQERIVYQPSAQDFEACNTFPDATTVTHQGTRMYVADPHKPVAVLYHGNAGSACDRGFYGDLFSEAGYGYIVVEYAGYSNDPEPPSHDRIKQDVVNVIDYLKTNGITDVTIVGESIGTGVAAYHTALAPPEKLLLLSPFTDLHAVARTQFWFYPADLLVENAFDNVQSLRDYSGQVTIIHGAKDTIIPKRFGQTLFDQLSTEKEFITIPEAGHNDLFHYPKTYEVLRAFLTN